MSSVKDPVMAPVEPGHSRCYMSHKPLKIGDFLVYGGSCIAPKVTNADVYVGLDHGMSKASIRWPWQEGESLLFPIRDMGVPESTVDFVALVGWLQVKLTSLKLVHIGCIGGHGRTGMVLAALTKVMTGEEDAITYVRQNYCSKAVENSTQVDFLHKHFGIKKVEGSKVYHDREITKNRGYAKPDYGRSSFNDMQWQQGVLTAPPKGKMVSVPARHPMCIWGGPEVSFVKSKNVI